MVPTRLQPPLEPGTGLALYEDALAGSRAAYSFGNPQAQIPLTNPPRMWLDMVLIGYTAIKGAPQRDDKPAGVSPLVRALNDRDESDEYFTQPRGQRTTTTQWPDEKWT
jgi:hypothetical protein